MTSLATITILIFGLFLVRPLLVVLRIRRTVLMPIIFLLCTVGAFATASRLFDVYAMLVIGIGAFFLRRRGYQMAPFVLGLVLGPLLDKSLRRGLVLSDGSTRAVLHPADLARLRGGDDLRHPALRAGVQGRGASASPAAPARRLARWCGGAPEAASADEARPLQRSARRAVARGAVRARGAARLRRPRDRAVHARRCAGAHRRRRGAADPRRGRGLGPGRHRPALAAGQAVGPVGHRSRSGAAPAHARRRDAADRPVRRARRQGAGARLAEAARGRRRRNASTSRAPRLRDFLGRGGRGRGGARRHLLHRAAVAQRDAAGQHRRRGGRDRARGRPAVAPDDDRLQRRRR